MHVSLGGITNVIKKLKTRKASGLDGINNGTIKSMPQNGSLKLLNILNVHLRKNYSKSWKSVVEITIQNARKDHSKPENN